MTPRPVVPLPAAGEEEWLRSVIGVEVLPREPAEPENHPDFARSVPQHGFFLGLKGRSSGLRDDGNEEGHEPTWAPRNGQTLGH